MKQKKKIGVGWRGEFFGSGPPLCCTRILAFTRDGMGGFFLSRCGNKRRGRRRTCHFVAAAKKRNKEEESNKSLALFSMLCVFFCCMLFLRPTAGQGENEKRRRRKKFFFFIPLGGDRGKEERWREGGREQRASDMLSSSTSDADADAADAANRQKASSIPSFSSATSFSPFASTMMIKVSTPV